MQQRLLNTVVWLRLPAQENTKSLTDRKLGVYVRGTSSGSFGLNEDRLVKESFFQLSSVLWIFYVLSFMRMDHWDSSLENCITIILVPLILFWREEVPIPPCFNVCSAGKPPETQTCSPFPHLSGFPDTCFGRFFCASHSLAFFMLRWGFLEEDWRQEQAYPQARAKEQLNWLK